MPCQILSFFIPATLSGRRLNRVCGKMEPIDMQVSLHFTFEPARLRQQEPGRAASQSVPAAAAGRRPLRTHSNRPPNPHAAGRGRSRLDDPAACDTQCHGDDGPGSSSGCSRSISCREPEVDGLAGVAQCFRWCRWCVAIAQGAIGGGFVTTVARTLGTGRMLRRRANTHGTLGSARYSPRRRDDRADGFVRIEPLRPYGACPEMRSRSRCPIRRSFCGRRADLVVQPPDGGGSGHRQSAGPGHRGLWRRRDSRPAVTGADLWCVRASGTRAGRRCGGDAGVLRVGNAGLRRLSLGPVRRPQADIPHAKTSPGRRSRFCASAACRPWSRPAPT